MNSDDNLSQQPHIKHRLNACPADLCHICTGFLYERNRNESNSLACIVSVSDLA